MLRKYTVTIVEKITKTVFVEAEDCKEAREIAEHGGGDTGAIISRKICYVDDVKERAPLKVLRPEDC